ncbi:MAG: phage tail family protein [Acutalibacteraceae bacterium]|nr:phage tail family protein [Acutalibacteraceae bacterium]
MEVNEFSYGGVESGAFNITCDTETHYILPEKRKYVQDIIGYDGVADFGISGYDVRVITLPIYFNGDYAELRANREKIIAWFYNNGNAKKLIFGNAPDRYYLAKVYAAFDFENAKDRHIGNIQFECNPPWQFLSDGTALTPEQITWLNCSTDTNQFIKEFSSDGTMRFVNQGLPVKPIIKIIGNIQSGLTLTYGTQSLKLNAGATFDGIAVDCNNETVTRMSDGESLYSYIDSEKDNFFEFASGNISLGLSQPDIGGYPSSVTVIVEMQITKGG